MLTIKKHVAERLHDKYASLVTEPALSCDDFAGFLEYPPDDKLGDLAFPCFRLSKELREGAAGDRVDPRRRSLGRNNR